MSNRRKGHIFVLLDVTRKQESAWDAFMHKSCPRWPLNNDHEVATQVMKRRENTNFKTASAQNCSHYIADFDTDRCLLT